MNRQDQDQDRDQQQPQPNRIRGPTSALTSFLRQQGIRVENRSRRSRRERQEEEERRAREAQQEEAVVPEQVASEDDSSSSTTASGAEQSTTSILYTPRRTGRRLNAEATRLIETARASSSKRKKKTGDSDDDYSSDGSETDNEPGPSSRPPRPRRNQIVFCEKCKSRFARPLNAASAKDIETENVCPSCLAGNEPKKPVKRAVKRRRIESTATEKGNRVPTLQDICINVVAQYIEDVEAFGDIGLQNMEKIAKIISKNRKLTTQTIRLFLEPTVKDLALYDCTNVDQTGLMNIAHFCPSLKSLKLIYCGQMTSEVMEVFSTRLKHLQSIELSGSFLVTSDAWVQFIKTVAGRLESFKLSHSFRFDQACMEALVEHCPNLRQLKLSRLVKMNDSWIAMIEKFTKLTSLELAWPDRKATIAPETIVKVLKAVGKNLTALALPGCTKVNDDVLLEGILGHCPNLKTLNLAECENITSEGVQKLFTEWKTTHPGNGLEHLNLSRCLDVNDEALKAIILHSNKTLKHVNLHSLDKLSAGGLEMLAGKFPDEVDATPCKMLSTLNCSFVRSMDDFVLKMLVDACTSLNLLDVWGCNQLTSQINPPSIRIVGRETEQ